MRLDQDLGFDIERARQQAASAKIESLAAFQGAPPSCVDLRDHCSPVGDQQELGACTAFAVGYGQRALIVRNSFGAGWGAEGYFYLPYAYATEENVLDIWTAS